MMNWMEMVETPGNWILTALHNESIFLPGVYSFEASETAAQLNLGRYRNLYTANPWAGMIPEEARIGCPATCDRWRVFADEVSLVFIRDDKCDDKLHTVVIPKKSMDLKPMWYAYRDHHRQDESHEELPLRGFIDDLYKRGLLVYQGYSDIYFREEDF